MIRAIRCTASDQTQVTIAGHTGYLTLELRRRRGQDIPVVLHEGRVVATFDAPYRQTGHKPGLVWYRSITGDWEGHTTVLGALRTLSTRHLPHRQERAA